MTYYTICQCGHKDGAHYDKAGRCMGDNSTKKCNCTIYRPIQKEYEEVHAMTNAKHTPGPWKTPGEDGGERVISYCDKMGKRRTLAHVYDGEEFGSMEANARLIAAAPELIAACKLAGPVIDSFYNGGGIVEDGEMDTALTAIRTAIEKAEGRIKP